MHPFSGRLFAARFVTSQFSLVITLAAGLSLTTVAESKAQHAGHHGHQEHATPSPAPSRRAAAPKPVRRAGGAHAGHGVSASDTPAVSGFKAAHASMMRGMSLPYTGDPDVDFRIQMIPHHQGAIDMARVAMRYAKDPWTRQLAESVIVEQQREIAEMQAWLANRGIKPPAGGQPRHIMTSSSYRQLHEEPGTRGEARGQSWAPSSGIPAW